MAGITQEEMGVLLKAQQGSTARLSDDEIGKPDKQDV